MDLLALNFLNKLQANNKISAKTTNSICFKSESKQDTFESSQDEDYKKAMEYLEKIKIKSKNNQYKSNKVQRLISTVEQYPQLAFLYNPDYSQEEKDKKITSLNNMIISLDEDCDLEQFIEHFIKRNCKKVETLGSERYFILPQELQDFLNKKNELEICTDNDLRQDILYNLIPDTEIQEIKGENSRNIYILKFKSDLAKQIYKGRTNGKIKTYSSVDREVKYRNVEALPLTFVQYETEDGTVIKDVPFFDTENPDNKKVLDSTAEYREFLTTLPFEYSKASYNGKTYSYIDMANPKNKELLDSTSDSKPKKSKYYNEGFIDTATPYYIPARVLINSGYGDTNELSKLAKKGLLKIETEEKNGKKFHKVEINEESYRTLCKLKDNTPNIYKLGDYAKQLGITASSLKYAIFKKEFEIIPKALFPYERRTTYINANTPKNKEFAQKIQFEQEFKKRELEQQREINKQERIEKQDLYARLNGVRMSLVWTFMPETKKIASRLARQDGYFSKLLVKEDNPEEELTQKEKVAVNKYRKEMWLRAGTDELKEAFQKANGIIQIYKNQGLEALDEEYRAIFSEYGFY